MEYFVLYHKKLQKIINLGTNILKTKHNSGKKYAMIVEERSI